MFPTDGNGGGTKRGNIANLRPWKPGQSGNPGGSSARSKEYRAVIELQETPERVAQVVDVAFRKATQEGDIPAAKLYLEAVRVLQKDNEGQAEAFALRMFEQAIAEAEARKAAALIEATAVDVTGEVVG